MTVLRAGAATDVGRVREINEDRYLADDELFAVADGVGGHQAGEVASQTSVEALRDAFDEPTTTALVEAVHVANEAVWRLAQSAREKRGMGTTLTAVALVHDDETDEDCLAVVNVGDSRAYLLQQGELMQVSEDHSLVEEMVRDGRITSEEALVHPKRSIITRALGMEPEIEVDSWELTPYTGDRVLLCSDGLTNELSEDRIAAVLRQLADPDEAARELVRQARAEGGNDNITVVVVDVVDDGGRAESASTALGRERRTASVSTDALGAMGGAAPRLSAPPPDDRPRPGLVAPPERVRGPLVTWRSGVFVLILLVVLGGAWAAIGWYARSSYYVGLDDTQRVAVYRGRPGGLLWFDPKIEDVSDEVTIDQVQPVYRNDVRDGKQFSSRSAADDYVARVRVTTTIPPTTTTTTTTTPAAVPETPGTTVGPPP